MKHLLLTFFCLFSVAPLAAQEWDLSVSGGVQAVSVGNTESTRYTTISFDQSSGGYYSYAAPYTVVSEYAEKGGGFFSVQLARRLNERWSIHHKLGLSALSYNSKTSRKMPEGLEALAEENVYYYEGTTGTAYSYTYERDEFGYIVYNYDENGVGYPNITAEQVAFDLYADPSTGNTLLLQLDQQLGAAYQLNSKWSVSGGGGFSYRLYSQLRDAKIYWQVLHEEYPPEYRQAVIASRADKSGTGFRPISAHVYLGAAYALKPALSLNISLQKSVTNLYDGANAAISSNVPGAAYPLLLRLGASYTLVRR